MGRSNLFPTDVSDDAAEKRATSTLPPAVSTPPAFGTARLLKQAPAHTQTPRTNHTTQASSQDRLSNLPATHRRPGQTDST
ncbi:MAG: hypothetical protein CMJ48_02955 [Planctomycetaceae bacterium]|nr:hypothetical protein [Planctomycetaceae bacterium]